MSYSNNDSSCYYEENIEEQLMETEEITLDSLKEYESQSQSTTTNSRAPTPTFPIAEAKRWQDAETRQLIELYRVCNKQIGPSKKFKKKENIWDFIKNELAKNDHHFKKKQVKNKFTQLLRTYKAVIDNNKKTGRRKRTCLFYKELHEMFGEKSSVNPPFTLAATEQIQPNVLIDEESCDIAGRPSTPTASSPDVDIASNLNEFGRTSEPLHTGQQSVPSQQSNSDSIVELALSNSPTTSFNLTQVNSNISVSPAYFKRKQENKRKITIASEIRAIREVRKAYYDEKLKAYKEFNERKLKLFYSNFIRLTRDIHLETPTAEAKRWQDAETRQLIELYRVCSKQIGPSKKFKKKENIWDFIKNELSKSGHHFKKKQVKNKFTQLLRTYKAVIDNNKKTGCRKRTCLFYKELHEIFGERSSVNPPFTLAATKQIEPNALIDEDSSNIAGKPTPTASSLDADIASSSSGSGRASEPLHSGQKSVPSPNSNSGSTAESTVSNPPTTFFNVTQVNSNVSVTPASFKKKKENKRRITIEGEIRVI